MTKKFLDYYYDGTCNLSDLKSYIDEHSIRENETIYDILGLSKHEYNLWKENNYIELEELLKLKKVRIEIIKKAKTFFKNEIAKSHENNIRKLTDLKKFNLNPFLDKYKANVLTGKDDSISIAKALVYPRVLGTSINTTFGNKMQKFCSEVLKTFASTTSGIDIEFNDITDGRKKYCQIKSGPNTINKDDVETINNHFKGVKNLARTNNLTIGLNDLVVGVFYGEPHELSSHYKRINETYPVIIGKEFWYRITGDKEFYVKITDAIADVAKEYDFSNLIDDTISTLAKKIDELEKASEY